MSVSPQAPVTRLRGVGPAVAGHLARLGIQSIGDLLLHLPRGYEDRSRVRPLNTLDSGDTCLVAGTLVAAEVRYGRRRSLQLTLEDGSGYLGLRFFHFNRAQQERLRSGVRLQCFGTVRQGPEGLEMVHPDYRLLGDGEARTEDRLVPVYGVTQGLGQQRLRRLMEQALALEWPEAPGLPWRRLMELHRPPTSQTADRRQALIDDLARDELTAYFLLMRRQQALRRRQNTIALPRGPGLGQQLRARLGFELTGAQKRVVREVLEDLSRPQPMLRLVQGDVGSGKTVVAAFAAIRAAEHGAQTALMAPTEILAEQHYIAMSAWLSPLGIQVLQLTGQQSAAERRHREEAIVSGDCLLAVGTHALFQNRVEFKKLALTIVDEQHRFGVHQRMALKAKGTLPHQLVLTATPIPRTLTMALYADMAVSVIDELPPGRQQIQTIAVADHRRDEVADRVAEVISRGQQAYWVCPLIDPSEALDAMSVSEIFDYLQQRYAGEAARSAKTNIRLGLLHGRMTGEEKAGVMADFKAGRIQLLVATTVIEVGVDVPRATLMVIESAERLGLAQLHQLRGRVGRGSDASHCVLLHQQPLSEVAASRLKVIRDSTDGFYIAEQDLALRGPGELLGSRQTGDVQFRIADLMSHEPLLAEASERADRLLAAAAGNMDGGATAEAQRLLDAWAPADVSHIAV